MFAENNRKMRALTLSQNRHCSVRAEVDRCGSTVRISQIKKIEDHFQLVLEHAHKQDVPADLHFCRDDRDHALQLFTGPCPVTGVDIKRFVSNSKEKDFFPHGAALVLTQSPDGDVAILLYQPTSEIPAQIPDCMVWGTLEALMQVTGEGLQAATRAFLSLCCDQLRIFNCNERYPYHRQKYSAAFGRF